YEPGSFRDPAGRIFEQGGRIFRLVMSPAAEEFLWLRDRGILDALTRSGRVVPTRQIDPATIGLDPAPAPLLLEHEQVPFVSYPYEWCFAALQSAALFHLDLHLDLLARQATMSDASAYNIQFAATRPFLIDVLSLRRYRDGELWTGHRQFCEQFLN